MALEKCWNDHAASLQVFSGLSLLYFLLSLVFVFTWLPLFNVAYIIYSVIQFAVANKHIHKVALQEKVELMKLTFTCCHLIQWLPFQKYLASLSINYKGANLKCFYVPLQYQNCYICSVFWHRWSMKV